MTNGTHDPPARFGIILATGEEQKPRSFIRPFRDGSLPKQYVNFIGIGSMVEHALYRARKLIPRDRIFILVRQEHLSYAGVREQFSSQPRETVIAESGNREIEPNVFLPLIHLYKRYPESSVAIFPSDYFISEQNLFIHYVAHAFRAVEQDPSRLVLLGIKHDEPDSKCRYILPREEDRNLKPWTFLGVHRFIENPSLETARKLIRRGALWNTMVMLSKTKTLLSLAGTVVPGLYDSFEQILKAIGTRNERFVIAEASPHVKSRNFPEGFLEALLSHHRSSLRVLPVLGVSWSEWGFPRDVERALKKIGYPEPLYGSGQTAANQPLGSRMEAEHGSKNRRPL